MQLDPHSPSSSKYILLLPPSPSLLWLDVTMLSDLPLVYNDCYILHKEMGVSELTLHLQKALLKGEQKWSIKSLSKLYTL